MTFAAPILLLGLLATAIPIAIHLIYRRRGVRRPFPAMELLLRSEKKMARGLKVKQLVLLALRILLFILLPLAMAQPFIDCSTADGTSGGDRLPASIVIVIDDSASMSWTSGSSTLHELAVTEVSRELRRLRAWDQAGLIAAGSEARVLARGANRAEVESALRSHEPEHGEGDLGSALAAALELHREGMLPARRTIVLTDGRASGWSDSRVGPDAIEGLGDLEIIDVGPDRERRNVSVDSLEWDDAPEAGARSWRVSAELRAHGGVPDAGVRAELVVDGESVSSTTVHFDGEERATATFVHGFEASELIEVGVRISTDEGVQADNVRVAPFLPAGGARVLLVNGDVRSVRFYDETFYLERALEAMLSEARPMRLRMTVPERFASVDVDEHDVIVLANVASLPSGEVERLEGWIRDGGGLFITMGDQIDPAAWSSTFESISPQRLRTRRLLSERDDPDARIKATRLATVERDHPIFRVFGAAGGESLQSATFFEYVLMEPESGDRVRTLASYGDGAPALVERRIGNGRSLLWSSTIDLDWTDFPIRTAFVPFAHRVVEYLTGRGGGERREVELGQRARIEVDDPEDVTVTVIAPDEGRHVLTASGGALRYAPTRSGLHRVEIEERGERSEDPGLAFAAVLPRAESLMDPADDLLDEWRASAARATSTVSPDGTERRGSSLWPMLLLLLLLVIYGESLLSLRRRLWERLRLRGASPV